MLFNEVINVSSENKMKPMTMFFGLNAELLSVNTCITYSHYWILKRNTCSKMYVINVSGEVERFGSKKYRIKATFKSEAKFVKRDIEIPTTDPCYQIGDIKGRRRGQQRTVTGQEQPAGGHGLSFLSSRVGRERQRGILGTEKDTFCTPVSYQLRLSQFPIFFLRFKNTFFLSSLLSPCTRPYN
jgi:hypothetical protein